MITICTFYWGTKYPIRDVEKLAAGLKRHVKQPYRFLVITDNNDILEDGALYQTGADVTVLKDPGLAARKGCFCRLRMFDTVWQKDIEIEDRLVCLDLDVVITRELDPLFDRPEDFVILSGANAANPCPFNGSIMMLRAGTNAQVWDEFTLAKADKLPFYEFPDDQGWLWHMLPEAATWKVGTESGIYAFQKPGWPKGFDLPDDARLVVFPGWRTPAQFKHIHWIKQHWCRYNGG